jgi:acetate kinase
VGAMAGALGGADLLIFTGGLGEHEPRVRRDIAKALGSGLIDEKRNESGEEGTISDSTSPVQIAMVRAREDLVLLHEVQQLLG